MARPRQVTDQQIVDATRAAIGEHGTQASLDLVAERLGVTAPALIKRYGSRQKLLLAALTPDFEELDRMFVGAIDERAFDQQLYALVEQLSRYFAATLPRVMSLRECGFSDDAIHARFKVPMPVRATAGMHRWLVAVKKVGLIEGDHLETAAAAIVGAITTRMISAHLTKKPWSPRSQKKHQAELVALFTRALGTTVSPKKKRTAR